MPTPPIPDLPEYHDDLLIVKVRPDAGLVATPEALGADFRESSEAPGLSTLALYERAGFIKSMTPLHRGATTPRRGAGGQALESVVAAAASFSSTPTPAPNAGVTMVELQPGTDTRNLQQALAQDPSIEYVSRVPVRYLMTNTTIAATPPPADTLWNLKKIEWAAARASGLASAAQVRVAVLDTGVDANHPDLPALERYVHDYGIPGGATSADDIVGHGTHVTGTICAKINNALGINGICDCRISALKIFSDNVVFISNRNSFAFVVDPVLYRAALADCVEEGEQVVNLSIGGYGPPDPQESQLFRALIDNGCVVVAAMGNENTSTSSYPAAIPGVVAVGATGLDDRRASFSNVGNHIALSAPGVGIWSTLPTYPGHTGNRATVSSSGKIVPGAPIMRETNYAAWDGTSMATPHVAAAAALAIAKYGPTSLANLVQRLKSATDTVAGMGNSTFTTEYGSGRLNLLKV